MGTQPQERRSEVAVQLHRRYSRGLVDLGPTVLESAGGKFRPIEVAGARQIIECARPRPQPGRKPANAAGWKHRAKRTPAPGGLPPTPRCPGLPRASPAAPRRVHRGTDDTQRFTQTQVANQVEHHCAGSHRRCAGQTHMTYRNWRTLSAGGLVDRRRDPDRPVHSRHRFLTNESPTPPDASAPSRPPRKTWALRSGSGCRDPGDIRGRHTLSQGEPQLGVQGCGGGVALVQQQPGLVAAKVAARPMTARPFGGGRR